MNSKGCRRRPKRGVHTPRQRPREKRLQSPFAFASLGKLGRGGFGGRVEKKKVDSRKEPRGHLDHGICMSEKVKE